MKHDSPITRRSPWLFRWFLWYIRRYVRRHFHALRVSRNGFCPPFPPDPMLVITNHPSWWDPLIGMLVAAACTDRELYAPIEAKALTRYSILGRLGLFGIAPGTPGGARRFLQIGTAILERPKTILAITAQGQFADARERPIVLRHGIGHLASRLATGIIVPVAFEYLFWNERLPEVLVFIGNPIRITPGRTAQEWTKTAARGLEQAQDSLSLEAQRRDPSAFNTILSGSTGIGGMYDIWKRLKAKWTGRRFRPEHGASLEDSQ